VSVDASLLDNGGETVKFEGPFRTASMNSGG